jgi:hypothetical protein
MDVALLPVIPDVVHDSSCCSSRHGSVVMVVADSTTPPSSPRTVLIRPKLSIDPQPPCSVPVPEDCSSISPPQSPPPSLLESTPDQEMDHDDAASPVQPSPPTKPPVRLLDDEQEHLHQSLRLHDFEVRGTLGANTSPSSQTYLDYVSQVPVLLAVCSSSNTVLRLPHQQIPRDSLQ